MPFVEDFNCYMADFGHDATLDGVAVRVIFDNAYREVFDGMATRTPMASLPTAQTGITTQASVFVTAGATYRVTSVQPDGTGWTTLTLERQ